ARRRALSGGRRQGRARGAPPLPRGEPVTPVRPATVARSLAIGNPADGDKAVATARRTGGGLCAVPEAGIGENMSDLAQHAGSFGETAAGVSLGALRRAVEKGELSEDGRVVLVVTGDGFKTAGPGVASAASGQ